MKLSRLLSTARKGGPPHLPTHWASQGLVTVVPCSVVSVAPRRMKSRSRLFRPGRGFEPALCGLFSWTSRSPSKEARCEVAYSCKEAPEQTCGVLFTICKSEGSTQEEARAQAQPEANGVLARERSRQLADLQPHAQRERAQATSAGLRDTEERCDTRMLIARYNHNGASMRIVDQFFKIFNDGYRDMNREEQGFLVSSTDDILSLGTVAYGRHFLFEQWERYTRLFRMREFVNFSTVVMSNDPECTIVRCDGKFDGRITRETIEVIFPHVLDDEELVQRVIGCKIRVPVMTLIYFDTAGRITRYDAHVGVFQGLNDLLASNPRDVVTMMAHARINDACMIPNAPGEMPEEMPYERLSPSSPIPRFFPIEEEEEDSRLSLDYILS